MGSEVIVRLAVLLAGPDWGGAQTELVDPENIGG
jgi:hypothetical protein